MKPIRTLVLLVLSVTGLYAQQTPVQPVQKSALPFKLFFEKVYLHTDREYYASGEDIWFKAYFVNGQSNYLSSTSNNMYVELISSGQKIISREIVRLNNGTGVGDFKLEDSIPEGVYHLRAYTNWMRNYGDNFIFEKKLFIHSVPGIKAGKAVAGKGKSQVSAVAAQVSRQTAQIRFFPEGGSMVEGVSSVLAFKTEDSKGDGIKVKGAVISSQGDTVSRFESTDLGIGLFTMTPVPGIRYQVKGIYADKTSFSVPLPGALSKGFALHVNDADTLLHVIISANPAQLNEYQNKELTLTVKHAGQSYYAAKIKISGLQSTVNISKKGIPGGVAAVTLYDDQLKPHCERLVFIPLKNDVKISVLPNKTIYKSRERVALNIRATDANNQPVSTNLSLAVTDAGITPDISSTITSYLLLESEVKGRIENAAQYFDPNNLNRFKRLDLLLLTQGWRDFLWRRIADTAIKISYMPEPGITISGNLTQRSGNKPIPDHDVTLFANGAQGDKIFLTKTDQQGKFFFDGVNLNGGQSVKISAKDIKGKSTGLLTLDSLNANPMAVSFFPVLASNEAMLPAFNSEVQKRMIEGKKISLSDTLRLNEVKIRTQKSIILRDGQVGTRFGYPDQVFTITSKDYDYKSLRHYLLTNVNGAMPDPSNDTNGIVFISQGKNVRPRFMVERREDVFDRMDYYELPMDQVIKVTVSHLVGMPQLAADSSTSSGRGNGARDIYLIYLQLKPTAFEKKELSLINTEINGYYQARMFFAPRYSANADSGKPDLRTTIYWQPTVTTNANGEATIVYFNADPKTKVRVIAEGITAKGEPVTGLAEYQVK